MQVKISEKLFISLPDKLSQNEINIRIDKWRKSVQNSTHKTFNPKQKKQFGVC